MSVQSDAAKAHIEKMLMEAYPNPSIFGQTCLWFPEYQFDKIRKWRFDYAVPSILCANTKGFHPPFDPNIMSLSFRGEIELDGGTGAQVKKIGNEYYVRLSGHNSPSGLRDWREKNNAAMSLNWRVWHYAPEEVIRAGRKVDRPKVTLEASFLSMRNPAR